MISAPDLGYGVISAPDLDRVWGDQCLAGFFHLRVGW